MPLVEYVPDPRRYEDVFTTQTGHGPIVRYRGSHFQNGSGFFPQVLKNLFSKVASFAKPFVAAAAPHAKAALAAAQPHLSEAASGLVKEATNRLSEAVSRRLSRQEGTGRRKRKKSKKSRSSSKRKRLRRIPPIDIPDFY